MTGFSNTWICTGRNEYTGLKANVNTLPTSSINSGTVAKCADTGEVYIFLALTSTWYLQP